MPREFPIFLLLLLISVSELEITWSSVPRGGGLSPSPWFSRNGFACHPVVGGAPHIPQAEAEDAAMLPAVHRMAAANDYPAPSLPSGGLHCQSGDGPSCGGGGASARVSVSGLPEVKGVGTGEGWSCVEHLPTPSCEPHEGGRHVFQSLCHLSLRRNLAWQSRC